jgi:hypothetical protein
MGSDWLHTVGKYSDRSNYLADPLFVDSSPLQKLRT